MATIVNVTGATYPKEYNGNTILPCEGESLVPSFASAYGVALPSSWSMRAMPRFAFARPVDDHWERGYAGFRIPRLPVRECAHCRSRDGFAAVAGGEPAQQIAFWRQ